MPATRINMGNVGLSRQGQKRSEVAGRRYKAGFGRRYGGNRQRHGKHRSYTHDNSQNLYGSPSTPVPFKQEALKIINWQTISGPQVFVLDTDDFYAITTDVVLFGFKKADSIKISNNLEFSALVKNINNFAGSIYIIDELFSDSLSEVVSQLKNVDPKSTVIITTAVKDSDIEDSLGADHIVVKSGRDSEHTIIKVLGELFGVEYSSNLSDPETE